MPSEYYNNTMWYSKPLSKTVIRSLASLHLHAVIPVFSVHIIDVGDMVCSLLLVVKSSKAELEFTECVLPLGPCSLYERHK